MSSDSVFNVRASARFRTEPVLGRGRDAVLARRWCQARFALSPLARLLPRGPPGRCVKVAGWRPSNRGRVSSSAPVAVQSFFRALFREEREPRGRGGSDPSGRALYHRGSGSPAFFRGSLRIFSGSSETGERERPAVSAASRTRTGRTVGRSDGDWAEGAETTSVFRRRPGSGASRGADH